MSHECGRMCGENRGAWPRPISRNFSWRSACARKCECFKIGSRIDYLLRVICRDIARYSELSDFMSRGEPGIEKFHGHVVLAIIKPFAGYPLDPLVEPGSRGRG